PGVVRLVPDLPDVDLAPPAVDGGTHEVIVIVKVARLVPVPVGGGRVGGGPLGGGEEHADYVYAIGGIHGQASVVDAPVELAFGDRLDVGPGQLLARPLHPILGRQGAKGGGLAVATLQPGEVEVHAGGGNGHELRAALEG